jgi:protein-S-isoprenylcysteine O-methyltransferase Ste14
MSTAALTVPLVSPRSRIRKHWAERRRATIALVILAPFAYLAIDAPVLLSPGSPGELTARLLAWSLFLGGAVFRFWATLYIGGRKGRMVVCQGPYSITRNPLYFGTLLMALAFCVRLESVPLLCGIAMATVVYLCTTIRSEERRLRSKLGEPYREYCRRVPRLWPRPSLFRTDAAVELDVACLAKEFWRAVRWTAVPLAAELLMQWRVAG